MGLNDPCSRCGHAFRVHDRIEQNTDTTARYRCTKDDCYCGEEYEPIIAITRGDETEAELEAIMRKMGQEHDRRRTRAMASRMIADISRDLFRKP